jgi:TonB family protein
MRIPTFTARGAWSILLAASLMVTNGSAFAAADADNWKPNFAEGNELVSNKQYEEALDEFVAAYLKLKDQRQQGSIASFNVLRRYITALSLAKMVPEANAVLTAMSSLTPLLKEQALIMNNKGVRALQASDFGHAIEFLEESIKLDPGYSLAKKNIAVAYNNYGLATNKKDPHQALRLFRKALMVDTTNNVTRENFRAIIKIIGQNPDDYAARIKIADELLKKGDALDAYVEYTEALRLHNDESVRAKIKSITIDDPLLVALGVNQQDLPSPPKEGPPSPLKITNAGSKDVDFGPFMAQLQKTIKSNWFPPKGEESKRCVVIFKVRRDGVISNNRILQSSGVAAVDKAALNAIVKSGKMQPLPPGAPADVDISFTFDYNVFHAGDTKVIARKQKEQYAEKLTATDQITHTALKAGILRIRDFYAAERQKALQESLLKEAVDHKEKAIGILAQIYSITPGASLPLSFDSAMQALGKNPASEEDLIAVADSEEKAKNWTAAVYVLNRATEGASERLKHKRRSAYAYWIAEDIKGKPVVSEDPGYSLYAPKGELSEILLSNYAMPMPEAPKNFPPIPKSIDLAAFVDGGASESASKKATNGTASPPSLTGTDTILDAKNAEAEIRRLSGQLAHNSNEQTLRVKQSVLLVQYGNAIRAKSVPLAASKYREALYMYPANTAAMTKLNECLKQQKIDPTNAQARYDIGMHLWDAKNPEAALIELREFCKLQDDGPANALVGMCLLDDASKAADGVKHLQASLNKAWPKDTESLQACVHVALAKLLQFEAEFAKDKNDRSKILSALTKQSSEYRLAACLDPNNTEALQGLLDVAKEAVRYNNNSTNNLMLGGAFLLKGNKEEAKKCYTLAVTQSPKDPVVKEAYDKYLTLVK